LQIVKPTLLLKHFDQSFVGLLSLLRARKPLTANQQLFIENRLMMLQMEYNSWATQYRKRHKQPLTLGDVLYAKSKSPVSEQDWAMLVQSIAEGDQLALHGLYEMAHRLVFTLSTRITVNRETAEELTIDLFHDIWRGASRYDPTNGTVLGWIMNQARSRPIDRLRFESRHKGSQGVDMQPLAEVTADPYDVLEPRERGEPLRAVFMVLTPQERQAIEATFFAGLTHAEAAVRLNQPLGAIKTRIRSGLHKLWQRRTAETGNMSTYHKACCEESEITCMYAAQALAASEIPAAEAHIASCQDCQREVESLRPVVNQFLSWPTDVLRPPTSLQARLALRIAEETGKPLVLPPARRWSEPEWEHVAPGIECKLLATDDERHRVSMLVRLAPGASYPAHTHAGVEELHLLDGELWIDECKLFPGDYNYGAPDTGDERVWSETGCTCVLITSTKDTLL
jgi:RNA polymerase sigma factor (sigma-70 family)